MEKNVVLKPQRLMDARQLVIAGLLVGITVFLGLSGYGFIPLFTINATILHVPTIIGAIVAGPKVGCMVGFFLGYFLLYRALDLLRLCYSLHSSIMYCMGF